MPQIPVYEGRTIREAPLGASPLGAAAFGGVGAKQLEQFGDAATKFGVGVGKAFQAKAEKEDDDAADLALGPLLEGWGKFSADASVNRVKGNAANLVQDADSWWETSVNQAAAGLSEGARRKLADKTLRFRASAMGSMAAHEAKELNQFKIDGIQTGISAVKNNATSQPSPENTDAAVGAMRGYTRMLLEAQGYIRPDTPDDDPKLREAMLASESELHVSVLAALLDKPNGAVQAEGYLNRYGDRMTNTARMKAIDTVDKYKTDEKGFRDALVLVQSGKSRGEVFDLINATTDPALRNAMTAGATKLYSQQDAATAADNKLIVEKVWGYVKNGGSPPTALVEQMPHDQWIQYQNFLRIRQKAAAEGGGGGVNAQGFPRHTNYDMLDYMNNAFARGDIQDIKDLDRFKPFLKEADFRAARATFATRQTLPIAQIYSLFSDNYRKPKGQWTDADREMRSRFTQHMAEWVLRTKTPEGAAKEAEEYFKGMGTKTSPTAKLGDEGYTIPTPPARRDDMVLALNAYLTASGKALNMDVAQRRKEIESGLDAFYTKFGREAYTWLENHRSPALPPDPFTFAAYAQLRERNLRITPEGVASAAKIFRDNALRDADRVQRTDATRTQMVIEQNPPSKYTERRKILSSVARDKTPTLTPTQQKLFEYNPD